MAWSLAELAIFDAPLLQSIAASALARISEFGVQDLSNTAWSFAKLLFRDTPLLGAISEYSRAMRDSDDQIMSAFVWALWRRGSTCSIETVCNSWPTLDTMAVAFILMEASWSHDQDGEQALFTLLKRSVAKPANQ